MLLAAAQQVVVGDDPVGRARRAAVARETGADERVVGQVVAGEHRRHPVVEGGLGEGSGGRQQAVDGPLDAVGERCGGRGEVGAVGQPPAAGLDLGEPALSAGQRLADEASRCSTGSAAARERRRSRHRARWRCRRQPGCRRAAVASRSSAASVEAGRSVGRRPVEADAGSRRSRPAPVEADRISPRGARSGWLDRGSSVSTAASPRRVGRRERPVLDALGRREEAAARDDVRIARPARHGSSPTFARVRGAGWQASAGREQLDDRGDVLVGVGQPRREEPDSRPAPRRGPSRRSPRRRRRRAGRRGRRGRATGSTAREGRPIVAACRLHGDAQRGAGQRVDRQQRRRLATEDPGRRVVGRPPGARGSGASAAGRGRAGCAASRRSGRRRAGRRAARRTPVGPVRPRKAVAAPSPRLRRSSPSRAWTGPWRRRSSRWMNPRTLRNASSKASHGLRSRNCVPPCGRTWPDDDAQRARSGPDPSRAGSPAGSRGGARGAGRP